MIRFAVVTVLGTFISALTAPAVLEVMIGLDGLLALCIGVILLRRTKAKHRKLVEIHTRLRTHTQER